MFTLNTTKMVAFALVLGVLSMMIFPAKAASHQQRVVDMDHLLNEKTRTNIEAMLSQFAKEGRVDMTVLLVNEFTKNPNEQAKKLVQEWEIRYQSHLPQKRTFLVVNTRLHQGVIIVSKDVSIDDSLQYALRDIHLKILEPKLIKEELNTSVFRACAAIAGALEDWPSVSSKSAVSQIPLVAFLKWLAQLSLGLAAIFGLRVLFFQPKWQDMPISDEVSMLLNQQASLGLSFWRSHRHIESV